MTNEMRYLQPGWFTRNIFNRLIGRLAKFGVSMRGSRVLFVKGRKTGELHSVPVNPLTLDGHRYLVSPRGNTQWSRNLRAAGVGELQIGRRREAFSAEEITKHDDKTNILRAYLREWKAEVGVFFEGIDANASDDDIRRIAPGYPVFEIHAPSLRAAT